MQGSRQPRHRRLLGHFLPDLALMRTRDLDMNPTVPTQRIHSPVGASGQVESAGNRVKSAATEGALGNGGGAHGPGDPGGASEKAPGGRGEGRR